MVVADNRAYEHDYEQYLNQKPIRKPIQEQKPKIKRKPKQKTHLLSILFVFAICILLITRYAIIAEINFSIHSLEKDYKNVLKENTDLNVQLMRTVNLDNLEKTALEKLNMQYPDQSQYAYVKVPSLNTNQDGMQKDYYSINEVQENKYMASVRSVLSKAVKLVD